MKKIPVIVILLTLVCSTAVAQELIGLPEKHVMEIMSADKPGLEIDNMFKNNTFRYLKYSSRDENETWVIFIDEKGKCKGVRITCDNSCYDRKVKELNDLYKTAETNRWSYRSGGDEITVSLNREAWFFTVTHERTNHKGKSGNDRAA